MDTTLSQKLLSLRKYKLFIFDLDGTLYDQRKLRLRIFFALLYQLLTFKISLNHLAILITFRKQREKHKGYKSPTIETDQYTWCSEKIGQPVKRIKTTIEALMYELPLKFLKSTLYPGVSEFMKILAREGYKIAVYSDYPIDAKLVVLGLSVDKTFCSTDEAIACLKPNKDALLAICQYFNCNVKEAIYVADRDDTDGKSAKMAGIDFIKINIRKAGKGEYYRMLIDELQII